MGTRKTGRGSGTKTKKRAGRTGPKKAAAEKKSGAVGSKAEGRRGAGAAKAGRGTDRHAVRATKKESEQIRRQLVQYMDSSGYVTWSAKKRKYVIMGSTAAEGGLVPCPSCGVGQLMVIRSPKSGKRFIGCTNFYGGCDASSPLLQRARLRATKKPCGTCGWPEVIFRYSIRQKWTRQCSNMACPTRAQARRDA